MTSKYNHWLLRVDQLLGSRKDGLRSLMISTSTNPCTCRKIGPIFEYALMVWSPSYSCYVQIVESVQKPLLPFAICGLSWGEQTTLPLYNHSLHSLEKRRVGLAVSFVAKLKQSLHNYWMRLASLPHAESLSRCQANYKMNCPMRVLCTLFNHSFFISSRSGDMKRTLLER